LLIINHDNSRMDSHSFWCRASTCDEQLNHIESTSSSV